MTLKAILFDFNGVIINDESIHRQLIDEVLIAENLRPKPAEYRQVCLGRSDRACLKELLTNRGRVVSDNYLLGLVTRKTLAYQEQLEKITRLPIYPGLEDLIFNIRASKLKMGLVSGATRAEVDLVLNRAGLAQHFSTIVTGDEIIASKPAPDGYLLAVERLNQLYPDFNLKPSECLAIEDTPAGIQAAKSAGMQVVGVANTYPFHMIHRLANWVVDYLNDLELDRVKQVYARNKSQLSLG